MKSSMRLRWAGTDKLSLRLLACTALAVAATSHVLADESVQPADSSMALEEIVVTAQKRGENLQNVPIAVSAFSASTLEAANVTGLADLASITPTLRFSYSGPVGSPFLRGVGSSTSFAGAEAEVQTYIDNVYFASGAAAFTKFNNIDRIEVDKGPQGTLFGRNATGGVIQVFTRDPSHTPTLDVSVGYGNYNEKEADLYASDGFGAILAGDIAIHFDDHQGWGRNLFLNTGEFATNNVAVRSKWVLTPSDDTRLTFIADYGRDVSDYGAGVVLVEGAWRPSLALPVPPNLGYYSVNTDQAAFNNVRYHGASLKLDTKFNDLSFVSITAYRNTRSSNIEDADQSIFDVVTGSQTTSEDQVSQEFQLFSPTDSRLQWMLGSYLYYNDAKEDPASLSGELVSFLTPPGAGVSRIDNYSEMITKSAALFGQATYTVTDATRITAGLRYTYDYRTQSAHIDWAYPTGPAAAPTFGTPFGLYIPGVNDYPNASFKAPTGKLTVQHDLSDHAMVYVGYNRGFKSGTFNNTILLTNPTPALKPEYMDAFEGGLKSEVLDGRLRMNLSAFFYHYTNLQVNKFEQLSISVQNAASANIKGVDGDFEYALTHDTRLSAGLSLLDAKYTSFPDAPLYSVLPSNAPNFGVGGYGGVLIGSQSATGNYLPRAPKYSGYFAVNQRVMQSNAGEIDLNANVSATSRTFFTPDNLYSQGSYALLSASAKWTSADGKLDVTLWGRNLTDRNIYADFSISGYAVGSYPNEPRSYGARIGAHFR